jgi:ABC-type polysaccharide/polyol phosphate transport system ATPase subunit
MLPRGSIRAEHVWKRFRRDRRRSLARDRIARLGALIRGDANRGWRWALRDVDLTLDPGSSVGLVGLNGSGKSTLLKILTQVMYPYAGKVEALGRIGALIEVKAGIHPELTGRENIALYGSLLGLKRSEVAKRFDEIVAFAELDEAIDRQLKHYSSGMYMRLGFAVAAFLEPDILLVDEVLAVGDASFQQKCLGRMRTVLNQGTTLVFVSHDLSAVEATCERGVVLGEGTVRFDGPVHDALAIYRHSVEEIAEAASEVEGLVRLVKAEVTGPDGGSPRTVQPAEVRVVLESAELRSGNLHIGVSEGTAAPIFVLGRDVHLAPGQNEISCAIADLPLPRGRYYVWMGMVHRKTDLFPWRPVTYFDVLGPNLAATPQGVVRLAPVYVEATWNVER